MIKNFLLKRGDQLSFTINFSSPLPISNFEWGIKENYDGNFVILKSLNIIERNVLFIGDSYLEGWTPDGKVKNWGLFTAEKSNLVNYRIIGRGGAGFVGERADSPKFIELLNMAGKNDSITDIIVCGGYNDRDRTTSQILTAMTQFCDRARELCPNASIKIGMVGWSTIVSRQPGLLNAINAYKTGCINNNVTYMTQVTNSLHSGIYFTMGDSVHPNEKGQEAIADNLLPYLPTAQVNGISKINDYKYSFILSSADTDPLNIGNYVYDIRYTIGENTNTALSGKLMIKDSVFEG